MSALPEGARCGRHPDAPAVALCGRCGDFLCARCAIALEGASYCAACEPLAGEAFPWERRAELGVARALLRTTVGTLSRTRAPFAPGFRDRSPWPALAYALAVATPVAWIGAGVERLGPSGGEAASEGPLGWLASEQGRLALALGAPIHVALAVLLLAAGWWLGLAAAGAPRRPFSHVVRAVAYVHGAVAPLSLARLLPGVLDGPLWVVLAVLTLVLSGRALTALTRASGLRVAAAGLLMLAFLAALSCGLGALLASLPVP